MNVEHMDMLICIFLHLFTVRTAESKHQYNSVKVLSSKYKFVKVKAQK